MAFNSDDRLRMGGSTSDLGTVLCDYTSYFIMLAILSVICILSLLCNMYLFMKFACFGNIRSMGSTIFSNTDHHTPTAPVVHYNVYPNMYPSAKEAAL